MADNNINDWEDIPLQSEQDDWEEIPLETEAEPSTSESELQPQSMIGRADIKAIEDTGLVQKAGKGLESIEKAIGSSSLGKGLEGMITTGLSKVGRLEPEDIKGITKDVKKYKNIKSKPGELPVKMAELADEMGDVARTSTKNLPELIDVDTQGMKREDFLGKVKERISDSRLEPSVERVQQSKDAEKGVKKVESKIQKAQEKYTSKLTELENKLAEAKQLKAEYSAPSDKLLDAKVMADKEVQNMESVKDSLLDEIEEYDDPKASKEIRKEIRQVNQQKRKLKENLTDLNNQEKVEVKKSKKIAQDYDKRVKDLQSEIKKLNKTNKKDLKTLEAQLKEAKKVNESMRIRGAGMSEANQKAFEGLERSVDYTTDIKGKDLSVAKEYGDKLYGKEGDDVRKAVRDIIREESPLAKEAMDKASTALKDRENVMKSLGISDMEIRDKGITSSEAVLPKGGEASTGLATAMTIEKGAEGSEKTVKTQLENALKRAGKADLIDDLELNRIAKLAQADASVVDAYLATKGLSPSAITRIAGDIGTKAQELGARALGAIKDSGVTKALGTVAKGAAKTLPFVAAGMDYAEAGELGIENELGKAAYVGLEQLNPLPFSTGQAVKSLSEQAPMRQAAARRAQAANFGLQDYVKKPTTIKTLENPEDAQKRVYGLSKLGSSSSMEYARRMQNIIDGSSTKEDYERKMSMLATEPAFKKLIKKLSGEEDGEEN